MNDQMDFSAELATAARDADMARVDQAADPEWKDYAYDAVLATAAEKPEGFIVDDVWKHMPEEAGAPREPRAMGPVLKRAQRDGAIKSTDRFLLSDRVTAHRNPRRVWVAP